MIKKYIMIPNILKYIRSIIFGFGNRSINLHLKSFNDLSVVNQNIALKNNQHDKELANKTSSSNKYITICD